MTEEKVKKLQSMIHIPLDDDERITEMTNYKDKAILIITSKQRLFFVSRSSRGLFCREVVNEP